MWLGRECWPSFQADQKESCPFHTLSLALPTIIIYPALLLDTFPTLPLPTEVSRAGKPQLEARALPSPLLTALLQELCQYQKSTVSSQIMIAVHHCSLPIKHNCGLCLGHNYRKQSQDEILQLSDTTGIGSNLTKKGIENLATKSAKEQKENKTETKGDAEKTTTAWSKS